ncbi:hypothetical protein [Desulfovibrio sp.]|uniref:hypothetical protein n=1 Tax=Desulfovibrio sp. TaxID=885 RepID=UPI003AB84F70
MAFNVSMQTPMLPLGKMNVSFTVYEGEEKMGELHISKGAAAWFPANAKKGFRVSWTKLGKFMEENGTKCENR